MRLSWVRKARYAAMMVFFAASITSTWVAVFWSGVAIFWTYGMSLEAIEIVMIRLSEEEENDREEEDDNVSGAG